MAGQETKRTLAADDPLWYKDAIIYELHVRAFFDSDGDGIGDFRGLTEKLDYLQDLGVTALWLLPFYPSPLKDDGYDIADYTAVHPIYGRWPISRLFLREAHRRGLRVITELVLNHTSDQHPWFQRARRAKPGSRWRDFYVWSDTPDKYRDARIIFKDFETSNWTWDPLANAYYWHRFYSHQPDLNFDNPEVREAMLQAMRLLARHGRGRPAAGRRAVPVRAGRDQLREPARDPRVPEEAPRRTWTSSTPTACCWRRPTSGPKTRSPISGTATNATWPSTSRSCRACSWPSAWKTASRSRHPRRRRRSRETASGPCSCATTTS